LAHALKKQFPSHFFVFSTTTETGQAEAQRSLPFVDQFLYLPLDFRWIVGKMIQSFRPELFILTESDYWFNLLDCLKNSGTKIVVINAKISERSKKRLSCFPWFAKALFAHIDFFCVQSTHYLQRFLALGVPLEKMKVTGNLKFDEVYSVLTPEELKGWQRDLGIDPRRDHVLVVGSSHDPEEKFILDLLPSVWNKHPHLKVIIVPRHPERFNQVEEIIQHLSIPYRRYTKPQSDAVEARVILLDKMGVLRTCYQLADIAIVAGSYTEKVGGHNLMEPAFYGVPVLFGPYMHSQPELLSLMLENQAGLQVPRDCLANVLSRLLDSPEERKHLGEAGLALVHANQGALQTTLKAILGIYSKSKSFS